MARNKLDLKAAERQVSLNLGLNDPAPEPILAPSVPGPFASSPAGFDGSNQSEQRINNFSRFLNPSKDGPTKIVGFKIDPDSPLQQEIERRLAARKSAESGAAAMPSKARLSGEK